MIEIIEPGPLATLQDLGRTGYTELGVGRSGAADLTSHRLANRLVGNDESAAAIEITLGGFRCRLTSAATVSLTGARCPMAGSRPLDWYRPLSLPAGTEIGLGSPEHGVRSYLAVRGGVAAEPVLGSRSTDTLAGLGPVVLRAGSRLPVGTLIAGDPSDEAVGWVEVRGSLALSVFAGPRRDWFTVAAWDELLTATWTMHATSNRIGLRLAGPVLERSRLGELPSEATLPGAVQVPGDGQPIVLGPDAPVTGGYPVIAVLAREDLDRLAQYRPGDAVRFRQASVRT